MSSDKLTDYLVESHKKLLDYALTHDAGGFEPRADELEEELAEANQTITKLRRTAGEYDNLRQTLFRERDENRERERNMTSIISELEAQHAQDEQRFTQLEAQRELAALLTDTEREDLTRLVGQAVEFFEDDPDRAWRALTRAHLVLKGNTQ